MFPQANNANQFMEWADEEVHKPSGPLTGWAEAIHIYIYIYFKATIYIYIYFLKATTIFKRASERRKSFLFENTEMCLECLLPGPGEGGPQQLLQGEGQRQNPYLLGPNHEGLWRVVYERHTVQGSASHNK